MTGSKIRLWGSESSASENATAAGLNFAEGQLPSTVNNSVRSLMGQLKDTYAWGEHSWVEGSLTVSVASQTTFKQAGDQTSFFMEGRRVRLRGGAATVFATVVSASFTSETTVTIVDASGSLSSSMSVVGLSMSITAAPRRADKLDVSGTLSVNGNLNLNSGWGFWDWNSATVSRSSSGTVVIFLVSYPNNPVAYALGQTFRFPDVGTAGVSATRINVGGLGELNMTLNNGGGNFVTSNTLNLYEVVVNNPSLSVVVVTR